MITPSQNAKSQAEKTITAAAPKSKRIPAAGTPSGSVNGTTAVTPAITSAAAPPSATAASAQAKPAGAASNSASKPSMRHRGRRSRPIRGVAASSAAICGSASKCRICSANPAAAYGTSGSSHPNRRGNRSGRDPDTRRVTVPRGPTRLKFSVPALIRTASARTNTVIRRNRAQISTMSAPVITPPEIRAATAAHSPSRIKAKRSGAEREADMFMRQTGT